MQHSEFSKAVRLYAERQPGTSNIDWTERRDWWKGKISNLISDIETWLTPLSEANLISISRVKILLREENIGSYEVDALHVHLSENCLYITPVGTFIIGGLGRFDIEGPLGTAIFILTNDEDASNNVNPKESAQWFIAAHPKDRRRLLRPLTEDSFQELFLDLFGISN